METAPKKPLSLSGLPLALIVLLVAVAVRTALAALGKDGASALAVYERYWKLNGEIVGLSRQNTNVRSFTLSLERKTKVLAACDEALRMLEENIRERMATKATR